MYYLIMKYCKNRVFLINISNSKKLALFALSTQYIPLERMERMER